MSLQNYVGKIQANAAMSFVLFPIYLAPLFSGRQNLLGGGVGQTLRLTSECSCANPKKQLL